jgi:hypothetical protein
MNNEKVDLAIRDGLGPGHTFMDLDYFTKQAVEANPSGLFLEFGVASGSTINKMAKAFPEITFHGFDSFKGLPEIWRPEVPEGTFACDVPTVEENVKLHIGMFQDTLQDFLTDNPSDVSFVHLDADLYSSTAYVLEKMQHRFVEGTIVVLDELAAYSGYQEHEYKAFNEFLERTSFDVDFLGKIHEESYVFKLVRK